MPSTMKTDWTGCGWVESVADRLHGTPVLIGTRMDADGVVANFDSGTSVAEITNDYGVNETSVRGVLAFAGRLRAQAA